MPDDPLILLTCIPLDIKARGSESENVKLPNVTQTQHKCCFWESINMLRVRTLLWPKLSWKHCTVCQFVFSVSWHTQHVCNVQRMWKLFYILSHCHKSSSSLKWSALNKFRGRSWSEARLEQTRPSLGLRSCDILKHFCSIFWFAWSIIEACFKHSWFILEAYFQSPYLLHVLSPNLSPNLSSNLP